MAKPSESTKHAYTYIPPSVQKSLQTHMDRTMPAHLQKYQQGNAYVPYHAQKAMSDHMQKNLPSHLKKYADPYLHQTVIHPGSGNASVSPAAAAAPSPVQRTVRPMGGSFSPSQNQGFTGQTQAGPTQPSPSPSPDTDPYGFIMNPPSPARQPFTLPGDSMGVRVAFGAGAFIILLILFSFVSSFLNKSNNLQKQKLLSLAQTQSEIASVADTASQKITDKDLLYRAATVKVTMESSKQQVIGALANRGKKKVNDKEINLANPADAAALSEGEQNGRYDDAYIQLLKQQLGVYQQKLQDVYNSGTVSEKTIANAANDQIELLLNDLGQ